MKIGPKESILLVVILIIVFAMGGIVMKAIVTPIESGSVCNDDIGVPIPDSSPQKKPDPVLSAPDAGPPPQPGNSGIFVYADGKLHAPTIYRQAGSYNGKDPIMEFSSQPIKIVFCGADFISSQSPNLIQFEKYRGKPCWSIPEGITQDQYNKMNAWSKENCQRFTESDKYNIKRGPIKLSDDTYYFDMGILPSGWYSLTVSYWPGTPETHAIFFYIK